MSTTARRRLPLAALALAFLALVVPTQASATITYGTLSNFDVFNDTGAPTHGFEIELEGLSSSDVQYTFGAPYERYGDPRVVAYPGGVYVRYESPYDPVSGSFTEATPLAPSPITATDGHSCWNGWGMDYATSGCEHFGVSLARNPTNTVYRWLVADPANAGQLKRSDGTVSMPAPVWNVTPPPPDAVNPEPVVAAVIAAPEPGPFDFGDALWVKVYKTESPLAAELDHLLTDDPAVPQDASETETEWFFLQAEVGHGNPAAELANEAQLAAGNKSVTRRYEIYAYTGVYDAETHEARPISDPTPDPADLGDYLGAQMAAVNVDVAPPPPAFVWGSPLLPTGEVGVAYAGTLVSGGVPSYSVAVTAGSLPPGLAAGTDGTLSGTPTASGAFPFTVEVTDQAPQTASGSFDVSIAPPVSVTTQSLPVARSRKAYTATLAAAGGLTPYAWSLVAGTLPAGLRLDPATGVISGVATKKAKATLTFAVTDGLGARATRTLLLTVK